MRCVQVVWLLGAASVIIGVCIPSDALCEPSSPIDKLAHLPRQTRAFVATDIGYTVAASEPIDIEEDGVWEFAIKTATTPPLYGVYSYAGRSWVDGPRELPRTPTAWSANDYDGDGEVEYAFQWGDSIRLYDPATDADSTLWLLSGAPTPTAVFWGKNAAGRFFLAERTRVSVQNGFVTTYDLVIRDLMTGDRGRVLKSVIMSPFNASELIPDFPEHGQIGRVLIYETIACNPTPHTGRCHTVVQPYAVGPGWQTEAVANFVDVYSQYNGPPDGYFGIEFATVKGDEPASLRFIALGLPITSVYMQAQMCSFGGLLAKQCTAVSAVWDYGGGLWIYDLDNDGHSDLIVPRKLDGGWELRDPYDLSLRELVAEMTSEPVNTGPLVAAHAYDMFYFQGRSLYVWGPLAKARAVRGTANLKSSDLGHTASGFRAHPNPFNSSVRLSWNTAGHGDLLEIRNILGQTVRRMEVQPATTSLEWDARDDYGNSCPSGMYFVRLLGDPDAKTIKVVLLK